MVGNTRRTSILDHIYVKNPLNVTKLGSIDPLFGDHVLVEFVIIAEKVKNVPSMCRDWSNYSVNLLNEKLSSVDWNIDIEDVQDFWNVFENKLIKIVDEIVPMTQFDGNIIKERIPKLIKNKINRRNRLLKTFKLNPTRTGNPA